MNILAQINKIVEDKLHQQVLDNAEIVEKTPPMFYVKALAIVGVMSGIIFGLQALKNRKK